MANISSTTSAFLAFLSDGDSLAAAKASAQKKGWGDACVQEGTIKEAVAYLTDHPTPEFLLVEVPSAESAPEFLDQLADVCAPTVKVIVAGKINEFSFFAWLKEVGVFDYLLEPFTSAQLEKILDRPKEAAAASPEQKTPGKIIAFMGTRGGVGTTTVLSNLAYLMDKEYQQPTAVFDMDIHFGTVAMTFDIEPTRGVGTLFEQPDRVDGLFLDRVMAGITSGLGVMSAEEPLKNIVQHNAAAVEALIRIAREKYRVTLIDLPRMLTPLTRHFLEHADQVVLVTEPTLLGLRDLIRMTDYLKTFQKMPLVVCNREGLAAKHEMSRKDFEKHYGAAIPVHIPYMLEAFATAASGEMLLEATNNAAGRSALHQLTATLLGEEAGEKKDAPEKKRLGWRPKGKA